MKKIAYLILVTLLLTGCSEEWLEIEPQNNLTTSAYFRDEADALASITAAYDPLHSTGTYALSLQYINYALDDRVIWEKPYWEGLMFKSDESRMQTIYRYLFRGVYRANIALEEIPAIDMDEELKNRFLAEAKFLRALYYFHLRVYFNEPPLVLKVIKTFDEAKLPNTPATEIWEQIEQDLIDVIPILPISYDDSNTGRATKGAAMALLGKTYLFEQKWTEAEDMLGQVIDLGVYHLSMPTGTDSIDYVNAYLCNFTPKALAGSDGSLYTSENNPESIFEIQNNEDPTFWNSHIGGYGCNGTILSAYFSIIGWKNVVPTAEFAAQFEAAPSDHPAGIKYDPRKYASVFAEGDTIEYREGLPYYNETFDPIKHSNLIVTQGYQLRKYYFPLHSESADAPYNDPNNWRYIRYADVLLMYAEAEYQLNGSSTLALNAINQVRERVGMPSITQVTPEAIIHERDVELGLECVRYLDLVRWSLLPTPWVEPADMITGYVIDKNEYLPIPLIEITKSEGLLKQNPGW